mmetsp:Transcript_56140/g.126904  ORF Transcript_56140/g.126904 Transcript_56140/m.126904 type:complete len:738 (+) Transcript_56140:79-2292(+)
MAASKQVHHWRAKNPEAASAAAPATASHSATGEAQSAPGVAVEQPGKLAPSVVTLFASAQAGGKNRTGGEAGVEAPIGSKKGGSSSSSASFARADNGSRSGRRQDGISHAAHASDWSDWVGANRASAGGRGDGKPVSPWGKWQPQTAAAVTWKWDDFIHTKDRTVRVELTGSEMRDSDLESLFEHLNIKLLEMHANYILNIDLSCNKDITDEGVVAHLKPFLETWPRCQRLKLYKTSIGDRALEALGDWVGGGHVHELHLSDLRAEVTGEAVYKLLLQVHSEGNYPYRNHDGDKCSLWLRLEHNGIKNTREVLQWAKKESVAFEVLDRPDLHKVRPGMAFSRWEKRAMPAMHLVIFHSQELRVSRGPRGAALPAASAKLPDVDSSAADASKEAVELSENSAELPCKEAEASVENSSDPPCEAEESIAQLEETEAVVSTGKEEVQAEATSTDAAGIEEVPEIAEVFEAVEAVDTADAAGATLEKGGEEVLPDSGGDGTAVGANPVMVGGAETADSGDGDGTSARITALREACKMVEALPAKDAELQGRWQSHLEGSADPKQEALRILRMWSDLDAKGYMTCKSQPSQGKIHQMRQLNVLPRSEEAPCDPRDPTKLEGANWMLREPLGPLVPPGHWNQPQRLATPISLQAHLQIPQPGPVQLQAAAALNQLMSADQQQPAQPTHISLDACVVDVAPAASGADTEEKKPPISAAAFANGIDSEDPKREKKKGKNKISLKA